MYKEYYAKKFDRLKLSIVIEKLNELESDFNAELIKLESKLNEDKEALFNYFALTTNTIEIGDVIFFEPFLNKNKRMEVLHIAISPTFLTLNGDEFRQCLYIGIELDENLAPVYLPNGCKSKISCFQFDIVKVIKNLRTN